MIVYVDLEHLQLQAHAPDLWKASAAWRLKTKYRLEEISGDHCLLVRFEKISPELLRRLNAWAVVVSGCYSDFEHYTETELAGLRAAYRAAETPMLGLCAGGQFMAQTYGAALQPLGPLDPGEPNPSESVDSDWYIPGMKQERGFLPVAIRAEHPLADGLGRKPVFFQAHYWEIESLPENFSKLASTSICEIQMFAHDSLPLFGTQFHPEHYDSAHPDGKQLIRNFFDIARAAGPVRDAQAGPVEHRQAPL